MSFTVAIVGVGENARDHARACRAVPDADLVAICDISESALQRFGDEFGIQQRFTQLDEMLAQQPLDIVIISTWGVHHAEVGQAVARSGKVRALLVEKPISTTVAECEQMMAVAREHNVLLVEGYKWRHDPQHLRVKEIIDSGRIGQVMSVHTTFSSPLVRFADENNWRYQRKRGGGSVFDTAGYLIHFSRYTIGSEPNRVYASGIFSKTTDVEMAASILLEFPGGMTAQLTSSYQFGYCQSTRILGTRGWIQMDLPYDQRSVRDQEFVDQDDLPSRLHVFCDDFNTEVYQFSPVNQFDLQLANLCECLETRRPHRISPEFSLGNMRVIDAVFKSLETRQPIDL